MKNNDILNHLWMQGETLDVDFKMFILQFWQDRFTFIRDDINEAI